MSGEIQTYTLEKRYIRKDGSLVWVSIQVSLVRDAGGAPAHFIAAIEDISLRKRNELEILELNATLEERVHERTAELALANKELDAFTYSVSHDLRAPLRAIDGFSRVLTEDYESRLDPEGMRVLGVISSETRRMGQLIDDLLTFSHLSRQNLAAARIDMGALVRELVAELTAACPERLIKIEVLDLPPARGDRAMMRIALGNLLTNAIKFTRPRNPGLIAVTARQEEGETIYTVKDNGVGFDMAYAGKLFGVFQRLHAADEFEGTGVGLALVQRVIHRHGGRVWAAGRVGEGAAFHFTLSHAS